MDIDGEIVSSVCVLFSEGQLQLGCTRKRVLSRLRDSSLLVSTWECCAQIWVLHVRWTRRCWSESSGGQWGPRWMWWDLRFLQPQVEEAEGVSWWQSVE